MYAFVIVIAFFIVDQSRRTVGMAAYENQPQKEFNLFTRSLSVNRYLFIQKKRSFHVEQRVVEVIISFC